jgi:hypothetical protein
LDATFTDGVYRCGWGIAIYNGSTGIVSTRVALGTNLCP